MVNDILSLISSTRLRDSTNDGQDALTASESDKGRIVNASAFRRLQQKAQVFPMDGNAAVRTRLTHSLEVAQVGRYLAQKVIEEVGGKSEYRALASFVNLVENACLLHDIGNPPFGHLGESAIQQWFAEFSKSHPDASDLTDFDGNPQGFRQVSFLGGRDQFGLNLTCVLLLSTIKYPWDRSRRPAGTKVGIFEHDWGTYSGACERVGWEVGKKFPFLRLMEAADDISYCMSDLEDALEKGILSWKVLREELSSRIDEKWLVEDGGSIDPFIRFKTGIINAAVRQAAREFCGRLDDVLAGAEVPILDKKSDLGSVLAAIKVYARDRIYSADAAERVELAGRSALSGLLDRFRPLLDLKEEAFCGLVAGEREFKKKYPFEARLLNRLPPNYVNHYTLAFRGAELARRAHLVVDFVAGMTDSYALETYQVLEGIRL